jgi:hypothetical protein
MALRNSVSKLRLKISEFYSASSQLEEQVRESDTKQERRITQKEGGIGIREEDKRKQHHHSHDHHSDKKHFMQLKQSVRKEQKSEMQPDPL